MLAKVTLSASCNNLDTAWPKSRSLEKLDCSLGSVFPNPGLLLRGCSKGWTLRRRIPAALDPTEELPGCWPSRRWWSSPLPHFYVSCVWTDTVNDQLSKLLASGQLALKAWAWCEHGKLIFLESKVGSQRMHICIHAIYAFMLSSGSRAHCQSLKNLANRKADTLFSWKQFLAIIPVGDIWNTGLVSSHASLLIGSSAFNIFLLCLRAGQYISFWMLDQFVGSTNGIYTSATSLLRITFDMLCTKFHRIYLRQYALVTYLGNCVYKLCNAWDGVAALVSTISLLGLKRPIGCRDWAFVLWDTFALVPYVRRLLGLQWNKVVPLELMMKAFGSSIVRCKNLHHTVCKQATCGSCRICYHCARWEDVKPAAVIMYSGNV